jgi:2-oxoisovalerate dehydrogenase E1 component beta subunit
MNMPHTHGYATDELNSRLSTKPMTMVQAINSALDNCMRRDPMVLVMGEDVGFFGGVFRCTEGLYEKFGAHRALDTPISEGGIVATAIGMAVNGLRPVVEMQFADYIYPAIDQIISELARLRHRSGGEYFAPVVVRAPCGGGIRGGQTHSQSPEGIFTHVCGLKTVMPSNPYDAKGLLISAIEDDDPVIFFEPKRIYSGPFYGHTEHGNEIGSWNDHPAGQVPEDHYRIPLGKAAKILNGNQVTVIAYGTLVHVAEHAIKSSGIDAELIDLRTLLPLDVDAITASVQKTGRCVVLHEATRTSGFGAELVTVIQENCFWFLRAPIERVTGWDTPYPHAFEWDYFPSQERIVKAMRRTLTS